MNIDNIWNKFLSTIKTKLSSLSYDTWFSTSKLVELNEELGYNAITMWSAWIIPRVENNAYSNRKLIEKKDGKFVITEKPEEYGEQSHAVYLVHER